MPAALSPAGRRKTTRQSGFDPDLSLRGLGHEPIELIGQPAAKSDPVLLGIGGGGHGAIASGIADLLLTRISHTSPTAAAARSNKHWRGVARCAPSSPLDVVSHRFAAHTPTRSSSPRTAPHHVLNGLATDRYEKCGLKKGP